MKPIWIVVGDEAGEGLGEASAGVVSNASAAAIRSLVMRGCISKQCAST